VAAADTKPSVAVRIGAVGAIPFLLASAAVVAVLSPFLQQWTCPGTANQATPSAEAKRQIPANYLRLYREAGRRYGVPWAVLAGIGATETDHGRLDAPGVHSGFNTAAGVTGAGCCAGPMQFFANHAMTGGRPTTWDQYGVDANHDGRKDVYNPEDAIPSAGNYLRSLLRDADGNLNRALFGYNHSQAYVNDVLARAGAYGGHTDEQLAAPVNEASTGACGGGIDVPVGPANLRQAVRITSPRGFRALPSWAMAGGRVPQLVDARIYGNVVWILRRYHLRVTAARESGHRTHGDGTAVDLVPADGSTQPVWDASAARLARDLGWTPGCARSGSRPTCPLAPAIQFIGYDGYPGHGSPRTCSGSCPAHLHISWASPCYGSSSLTPPCQWVNGFPAPLSDGTLAALAQHAGKTARTDHERRHTTPRFPDHRRRDGPVEAPRRSASRWASHRSMPRMGTAMSSAAKGSSRPPMSSSRAES
jgi:Transglycosylase SLT domain